MRLEKKHSFERWRINLVPKYLIFDPVLSVFWKNLDNLWNSNLGIRKGDMTEREGNSSV